MRRLISMWLLRFVLTTVTALESDATHSAPFLGMLQWIRNEAEYQLGEWEDDA